MPGLDLKKRKFFWMRNGEIGLNEAVIILMILVFIFLVYKIVWRILNGI